MPKDHLAELCKYLEAYGGSRNIEDYASVNYFPDQIGGRVISVVKRTDGEGEMCLSSKEKLVNLEFVQRKDDKASPLLQVGSCCVRKFIPKSITSNTRRVCMTCRKPLRLKNYSECRLCRINRRIEEADRKRKEKIDGKADKLVFCTTCGDAVSESKALKWGGVCWTCFCFPKNDFGK